MEISMNWLTFLANIVSALAWPIITLIIVLTLKDQIANFLRRVGSLKYKDLSIELDMAFEKMKIEIPEDSLDEEELGEPTTFSIIEIAYQSPNTAIRISWRSIEDILFEKYQEIGLQMGHPGAAHHILDMMFQLSKKSNIDPQANSLFRNMFTIRNNINHIDEDVSIEQAIEFINYSGILSTMIKNAKRKE
jgi:hypothetical protein